MDKKTVLKSKICLEHDNDFNEMWFGHIKEKSFISHIDTFYFMVTPNVQDWNKSTQKIPFIKLLKEKKAKAEEIRESIPIFTDIFKGLEVRPFFGAQMYSYHFGLIDNFDIFVCENVPNVKTPPIMIQIRSQNLWLTGCKKSFDIACNCIERILGSFDILIKSVQENRIDYAFHTNYIQDMINFFPEKRLKDMQISNFRRWHKEGYFYNDDIFSDYFTLGRRKSNNVFFRAYNKTKEVIEMGYKQFFIQIWAERQMISRFDVRIMENAFRVGSYASKDKFRCEFYCNYGKDKEVIEEITDKLRDPDTPMSWYANTAKGLVPDITVITNIELQTKRKFYDRISKSIPFIISDTSYRKNIYNLFEQISEIVRFLTHETIRFVSYKGKNKDLDREKRPYADWWKRLRSSKPLEYKEEWIIDYFRTYQKNLDIERQKLTSVNKMASMSAYMKLDRESESTIEHDINEFLSSLNDNDIKKYYNVRERKLKELRNREIYEEKRIKTG